MIAQGWKVLNKSSRVKLALRHIFSWISGLGDGLRNMLLNKSTLGGNH